jgi:hypothetical protein
LVNCNRCGKPIHFDDSLLSASGKKIPLEGQVGYDKHDCPNNPYNKGQQVAGGAGVPQKGNLQDLAVQSNIDELMKRVDVLETVLGRVGQLEETVEELGKAIAAVSFKKGSEVE